MAGERGDALFDDVVYTDFGMFDLVWADGGGFDGSANKVFRGQVNGFVGAADPRGLFLNLARKSGGSHVRIVLLDAAPGSPPPNAEDVVEVSVRIPDGSVVEWRTWAGERSGPVTGLGPGDYRVRVSARGMDRGRTRVADDQPVADHYLVEFWPAEPTPDEILRVGSESAWYWHRAWGSRR